MLHEPVFLIVIFDSTFSLTILIVPSGDRADWISEVPNHHDSHSEFL